MLTPPSPGLFSAVCGAGWKRSTLAIYLLERNLPLKGICSWSLSTLRSEKCWGDSQDSVHIRISGTVLRPYSWITVSGAAIQASGLFKVPPSPVNSTSSFSREGRLTPAGSTIGGSATLRTGAGCLPRRPREATPPGQGPSEHGLQAATVSALDLAWAPRPLPRANSPSGGVARASRRKGTFMPFGGSAHSARPRPWKQREELFVALVPLSQTNSKSGGCRTRHSPSPQDSTHTPLPPPPLPPHRHHPGAVP